MSKNNFDINVKLDVSVNYQHPPYNEIERCYRQMVNATCNYKANKNFKRKITKYIIKLLKKEADEDTKNKKKLLNKLTKKEFYTLQQLGMLYEFYPEAPEFYEEIKK